VIAGPTELIKPALRDYPFINIIYRGDPTGFTTADGLDAAGDRTLHSNIMHNRFGSPGNIDLTSIAPLEAMSDETFATLASILGFKYDDYEIRNRESLQRFSQNDLVELLKSDPHLETYSPMQLESFAIAKATLAKKNIHWGNFVDFYNRSAKGQQQAIWQYFNHYHGLELARLLEHKAKEFDLPESLVEPLETRVHNGNDYHYSQVLQRWLRDDAYIQQYRVDIVNDAFKTLVATAPTLCEALAKATAHLKETEYSLDFCFCDITQGGLRIAGARFQSIGDDSHLIDFARRPVKPLWLVDQLGCEEEIAEKIRTQNLTEQQIETLSRFTTPLKKDDFIKTLFTVEKAMGVQWSKVQLLEDALGL
jgi:hypothetical protein